MSTNLYWAPVVPREARTLPTALKYKLGPKLWEQDGTLGSDPTPVGAELIPFLEGLAACNVEGASELIELIEKYGTIEVWLRS